MPAHPVAAVLALALLTASASSGAPGTAQYAQDRAPLRFHHVHYRVGDPAAAMADALRAVDGVRVIAQGLGVGVRAGEEYLLFDRPGDPPSGRRQYSAAAAWPIAVEQLKAWGFDVKPGAAAHIRAVTVLPELPVDHLAFTADAFDTTVGQLIEGGARVLSRSDDAVLFAGGAFAIEIVRDADREETHWCPMHPDVRSADPGKCPLCAMDLVPIPPPKLGEYGLDVEVARHPESATIRRLRFSVREPDTNALVTDLQVVHERAFHLFVISGIL